MVELDADATVEKHASLEGIEFTILGSSDVEVVDPSHEELSKHTYTVHVESGIPAHCTCSPFEYQGDMQAYVPVALREPVFEAMNAERPEGRRWPNDRSRGSRQLR